MTETTKPRKSFREIQHDAILAEARERADERRRVVAIVNPMRGRRVSDVISIADGDYVVEVTGGGTPFLFTTVHNGKSDHAYFDSLDMALLHLIAQRHGSADSHASAPFYAARVLGIPEGDDR